MSHVNKIYDADPHFTINPINRQIKNESSSKTTLIQGDHNSERFSFCLDRIVEGHDMMECNRVEVHFNNNGFEDVYEVEDLQIKADDETKIVFSWLLSGNATKNEGKLEFSIRFACVDDEGNVEYSWNTSIHSGITISKGMNNADVVAEEIPDIIAQWKTEILGVNMLLKDGVIITDTSIDELTQTGIYFNNRMHVGNNGIGYVVVFRAVVNDAIYQEKHTTSGVYFRMKSSNLLNPGWTEWTELAAGTNGIIDRVNEAIEGKVDKLTNNDTVNLIYAVGTKGNTFGVRNTHGASAKSIPLRGENHDLRVRLNPSYDNEAVPKKYVDNLFAKTGSGIQHRTLDGIEDLDELKDDGAYFITFETWGIPSCILTVHNYIGYMQNPIIQTLYPQGVYRRYGNDYEDDSYPSEWSAWEKCDDIVPTAE